jgi:hypothetical protein
VAAILGVILKDTANRTHDFKFPIFETEMHGQTEANRAKFKMCILKEKSSCPE